MEAGIPILIVVVLALIVLSSFWAQLPLWLDIVGLIVIALLAGFGVTRLGKGGMASNLNPGDLDEKP